VSPYRDAIDGYQITSHGLVPTPGSPYPTHGTYAGFGEPGDVNHIATFAGSPGRQPCLFLSDQRAGQPHAQVESFAIAPTTGALREVSSLVLPWTEETTIGGNVLAAPDGQEVYVSVPGQFADFPSFLDVLTVSPRCGLTLASSLEQPGVSYVSIALLGSAGLLAVDNARSTLEVYRITNGTQLTLASVTHSQLLHPSGAAAGQLGGQTYTFNGLTTGGPGKVEAHTINGQALLGPVPGSPAEDPKSFNGASVFFDPTHQEVIEGETDGH
jgi:hypothetical protein